MISDYESPELLPFEAVIKTSTEEKNLSDAEKLLIARSAGDLALYVAETALLDADAAFHQGAVTIGQLRGYQLDATDRIYARRRRLHLPPRP